MNNNLKDLSLEFESVSDAQMLALAEFVKRVGWSEFRSNAVDDDEAYLIREGVEKLQDALAQKGFAPR